jgi:hypothetical protein
MIGLCCCIDGASVLLVLLLQEKKPAPFGWDAFNQQAVFNAAEKRASKIKPDLDAYK